MLAHRDANILRNHPLDEALDKAPAHAGVGAHCPLEVDARGSLQCAEIGDPQRLGAPEREPVDILLVECPE